MPYIDADQNVRLYAEDFDPGNARATVLFVHGWPMNGRMFERQTAALPASGIRCVTVDLRGFGYSDKPWNGCDYDTWAEDVDRALAWTGASQVVLAGFSMGGAVAMHYAANSASGRLAKLVLLGAAGPFLRKTEDNPGGAPGELYNGFLAACAADRAKLIADFGSGFFYRSPSSEAAEYFRGLGLQASARATARGLEELRDRDLRHELGRIRVPVLICHGTQDQIIPFALGAQEQKRLIPHANLIRFEESGHGLFWDEGEKLNTELTRFVLS